ncbi:MAG: ATP-dependent zinc metalloprotease FtsH, partial [Proteobacteria bacterium]|nr:ATP-dependent zinc metalloprotease FtsH [Pseudomonadota bacterium]
DGTQSPVYRTIPVNDPGFVPLLDSKGVEYYTRPVSFTQVLGTFFLSWILPLGIMLAFWWFLSSRMKGGGMGGVMSFGKNKAQLVSEGDTGVGFADVAGADESKEELMEVVDFLKHPDKYQAIGGKIPKGVLLVGPPGTGKTMLAKAVAGEAKVPFFKMSGSDFVELFVGVGAARVRDLFHQAKEKAPCIIFIDELDAIGKSRSQAVTSNDEREQTLNQLLVEMDGFDTQGGVILLAATNRPEVLDSALLRPGRFDRQILVDRPDRVGREAILEVHAKQVKLDDSVDLSKIAGITAGFVGADLANLVNEAAIMAVRSGREQVIQQDFDEAIEKTVAGLQKKTRLMNEKEREIVARHETGHALMAAFTPGADPVRKISIVPRGLGALGYTMQLPTEDRFLITEDELLGRVDVLLGGRAAEELIFGRISNGASNDLSRATDIVRKMITEYGMSRKFRNVFLGSGQSTFLGGESPFARKEYSEETQRYIDEQIAEIIDDRYEKVLSLLNEKRALLDSISKRLLEIEVLDSDEFGRLLETADNPSSMPN